MTVSQQIDKFIAENGGNPRDALNVALIRLQLAEDKLAVEAAVTAQYSDGYHTFEELYDFRKAYNAAFLNYSCEPQFGHAMNSFDAHKSWRHHDGELCLGGGWFIVSAMLPDGQISNHYEAKDWDLFKIPEAEKAKYEFDYHTPQDVIKRLLSL